MSLGRHGFGFSPATEGPKYLLGQIDRLLKPFDPCEPQKPGHAPAPSFTGDCDKKISKSEGKTLLAPESGSVVAKRPAEAHAEAGADKRPCSHGSLKLVIETFKRSSRGRAQPAGFLEELGDNDNVEVIFHSPLQSTPPSPSAHYTPPPPHTHTSPQFTPPLRAPISARSSAPFPAGLCAHRFLWAVSGSRALLFNDTPVTEELWSTSIIMANWTACTSPPPCFLGCELYRRLRSSRKKGVPFRPRFGCATILLRKRRSRARRRNQLTSPTTFRRLKTWRWRLKT